MTTLTDAYCEFFLWRDMRVCTVCQLIISKIISFVAMETTIVDQIRSVEYVGTWTAPGNHVSNNLVDFSCWNDRWLIHEMYP